MFKLLPERLRGHIFEERMLTDRYFTKQTFAFLSALEANNEREWFTAHQ